MGIDYFNESRKTLSLVILSLHWGFSFGGVAKFAANMAYVSQYGPVKIDNLCVLGEKWDSDLHTLAKLEAEQIQIRSRFDFSWIWKTRKEIERIKLDLIMTHGFNAHFVYLLTQTIYKHNIPVICSYHGLHNERRFWGPVFNKFTEYFIRKHALAAATVESHSKRYLISKGVHEGKLTVVHNGIKSNFTASEDGGRKLRRDWQINNKELVIGVISRIGPGKGISDLVDAVNRLVENHSEIKLLVVGSGKSLPDIKKQVLDLKLTNNVIFTGYRSDVNNCLAAFDIFVFPTLAEAHSIALLEAMRAAKPIIATDVGGNSESVRHEKEALLVPPADSAALAGAIEKLIRDEALRNRLATQVYQRFIENFTIEKTSEKTAQWMINCGYMAKNHGCFQCT